MAGTKGRRHTGGLFCAFSGSPTTAMVSGYRTRSRGRMYRMMEWCCSGRWCARTAASAALPGRDGAVRSSVRRRSEQQIFTAGPHPAVWFAVRRHSGTLAEGFRVQLCGLRVAIFRRHSSRFVRIICLRQRLERDCLSPDLVHRSGRRRRVQAGPGLYARCAFGQEEEGGDDRQESGDVEDVAGLFGWDARSV